MHIGHFGYLGAFIWPVVIIAGLVVIGAVFSRRAGGGSGRMWAGLTVLIVLQLLNTGWTVLSPRLYSGDIASFGAINAVYSILAGLAMLAGIALLASAATVGRDQQPGYLDPSRPGSPPTSYDPRGYGDGSSGPKPTGPGTNPYV